MTTYRNTAVPNPDPKRDLRVIFSPDGRILSDHRPKPQINFQRRTKVIGLKDVLQKSIDNERRAQAQNKGKG